MSLMRWKPASSDPFTSLQTAMNDLMQSFGRPVTGLMPSAWPTESTFWPSVDVKESNGTISVTADLPGMEAKDLDISVAGNTLVLKGERKSDHEEKGTDYYSCERSYGAFQRTLELPGEINPEKVQATFKNGVLSVSLAKSESSKNNARKIPIKNG